MRYETTESWHNAQARKSARWDAQQAAHDAATADKWVFPSKKEMAANPRFLGESLGAYGKRIKGGAK